MKNILYHSWKAPCSFCVATGSPVLRLAFSGCETPGCTRWLHGRNMGPSRGDTDHFHPCTPGRKNNFSLDMPVCQGPCRMPARCTVCNTHDPGAMISGAIRKRVKAPQDLFFCCNAPAPRIKYNPYYSSPSPSPSPMKKGTLLPTFSALLMPSSLACFRTCIMNSL